MTGIHAGKGAACQTRQLNQQQAQRQDQHRIVSGRQLPHSGPALRAQLEDRTETAAYVPPIPVWVRRAQADNLADGQVAGQARVRVVEGAQAVAPADHMAAQAVAAMDARMAAERQVDQAADHAPPWPLPRQDPSRFLLRSSSKISRTS